MEKEIRGMNDYGILLGQSISEYPELFEKIEMLAETKEIDLNPLPILKYFIRSKLDYLSSKTDRYELIEYSKFNGKFNYDEYRHCYVPQYDQKKTTIWLYEIYKESENQIIKKRWAKTLNYIASDPCDTEPEPELYIKKLIKHVYFLYDTSSNTIKIGSTIHIGTRKNQLESQVGKRLKLLSVIRAGGECLEKKLHEKFKEFRTRGEWFAAVDEIYDYMKNPVEIVEKEIKKQYRLVENR